MRRLIWTACFAAIMSNALVAKVEARAVKVLVMQEDQDPTSLERNTRIQNAVLSVFNQTLHAPAYKEHLDRFGLDGLDVYDETAVSMQFYQQDRTRRTDEELIALSRQVRNPRLDVVVLYTLYAKAVSDPYTQIANLQLSLKYKALNVKDGRYLGGDNISLDNAGVPFTGCAAGLRGQASDSHCVLEFVAEHAETLARDGGNKLALQVAALLGQSYGSAAGGDLPDPIGDEADEEADTIAGQPAGSSPVCSNVPTSYQITFRGFSQKQINFIEENIAFWKCVLNFEASDSRFSEVTYEYKTRASKQRILRNIRIMTELLGEVVEPKTQGDNEIIVEALTLRAN